MLNDRQALVYALCDGVRTSAQIAEILGETQKYVQGLMLKHDLPRRKRGSAFAELNGSYQFGRRIDRDGYVLTSAPQGHPHARMRANRNTGMIYEHRLVVERTIGRHLLPTEAVDHIDGLRLHNDPSNLRLFGSNGGHLKATISGQVPRWSTEGLAKLQAAKSLQPNLPQVNTYDRMKKSGDARLIQILLAMLQLESDSPYLLGTHHHLAKAAIVDLSRSNLTLVLAAIYRKYA